MAAEFMTVNDCWLHQEMPGLAVLLHPLAFWFNAYQCLSLPMAKVMQCICLVAEYLFWIVLPA